MTRKAKIVMAFVLAAATAAATVTAFACPDSRCHKNGRQDCFAVSQLHRATCDSVASQVINANVSVSQAMLRLKLKPPPLRRIFIRPGSMLVPLRR